MGNPPVGRRFDFLAFEAKRGAYRSSIRSICKAVPHHPQALGPHDWETVSARNIKEAITRKAIQAVGDMLPAPIEGPTDEKGPDEAAAY